MRTVDEDGNLILRGQRRAEIAVHCVGGEAAAVLTPLIDGFRKISVSERFQLAQIGIEEVLCLKRK